MKVIVVRGREPRDRLAEIIDARADMGTPKRCPMFGRIYW
jgi:CRISPR/Cas system-associated exonuclease Cas4 (RecB family)